MSYTFSLVAEAGFAKASSYDTHRPSYPPEAVCRLVEHLELANASNARVLDLGAGTGKFTELLARREEDYEVIAVEPHREMREVLERKNLNGVSVQDGHATFMPGIESQSIGAVVIAQAFHWFANREALQEIYRVIKPGGKLAMIWNIEDYNSSLSWEVVTKWEAQIRDITWSFDDNEPRFRHDVWRNVFDEGLKSTPLTIQRANPLFSLPLSEEIFRWTAWLTKDDLWERYHTLSQIAVLEGEDLKAVKTKVYSAMESDDVERKKTGEVKIHGRTALYWTNAIPRAPDGECPSKI